MPYDKKPKVSLHAKLMLIFLALALVPLLVIGWFSIKTTEDLIASMVIRQLQNVAVDKVAILERWLDERKADLMVVAGTSILKSMNPGLIAPYLDLVHDKYGVYNNLKVVSASGKIIFDSRKSTSLSEKNNSEVYIARNALYMSDITYLPEEQESSFDIAVPVESNDGKLLGTVYGSVGTNKIVFFILNVSLGVTGECYLVDKDGRFLAHKQPSRILTQNISQSESFKKIFEKRDGKKAYLDYRGIEVLGTSLNVGGTDWYIVVEQDYDEAFQSAKTLKRIIYITLILCIASALMLTWMISYRIVSPIRSLSRYAGNIADSKFDKPIEGIKRDDEIGLLYSAFEHMSRKLQERQSDLEKKVGLKEAELKETKLIAERSEKFAAMGRMGAAVAHEIRTPLTSIKLFLESVQDQIERFPEDKEDFRIAMKQVNRIEATINRFLEFTKPQALMFSVIDVAKLIEDVLSIVRPLANRQECSLNIRINNNLPPINGVRKLLSEALINLFINALEAMPLHGVVSMTAAEDIINLNGINEPCVKIEITDTGQGIPDDQIENIFEPFFTTKASGTGLGLPLVLNTIKNHGGIIHVKSVFQQGTKFTIFLPLKFNQTLFEKDGKNITD